MNNELKDELQRVLSDFFIYLKSKGIQIIQRYKNIIEFGNKKRTSGVIKAEYVTEPLFTIISYSTDYLEAVDTTALDRLLLQEYPLIKNYFDRQSDERVNTKNVIEGMIKSIYFEDPKMISTKSLIEKAILNFDKLVSSGKARANIYYTVENLDVPELLEKVEIDQDLFFVRLTEEQVNEYYEIEPASGFFNYELTALVLDYFEEMSNTEKRAGEGEKYLREKEEQMNLFLNALTLSFGGGFGFHKMIHRYVDYYSNFNYGNSRSNLRTYAKGKTTLTINNLRESIEKYKKLKTKNLDPFKFSLNKLLEAERRHGELDGILDAVIGLEYLLLHQIGNPELRGETRFRFSLNYASLFEKKARQEKRKLAQEAYDIRSKIVHGGEIKLREKFCNEELYIVQISDKIIQMLRETLNILIDKLPGKTFYDENFWIEQALGLN